MERLWNRNYIKVMTANFSLFFAFYLLTPLLPLYLHETFGATKDVIGLVLSGYTITALLFRPFSGYFVDSFPRKKVLMVCFAAFAIFFAGYLAAGTLLLFTIVRTLHGGPFGALTVANSTVAIDVLPSPAVTRVSAITVSATTSPWQSLPPLPSIPMRRPITSNSSSGLPSPSPPSDGLWMRRWS